MPVTLSRQVPVTWTDYNGHMNETHYLEAGSLATDRFMEMIGADAAYIAQGRSFFTVENHIRYLDEIHADDRLMVSTQVLSAEGKRLHLFHRLWRGDGGLAATVETMLLHTDLTTRRSSLPDGAVAEAMADWAARHRDQQADGAGRFVGQRI